MSYTSEIKKITKNYSDFSGLAALSGSIPLFDLAAKSIIVRVIMKHSAAFAGLTLGSLTMSVGTSTNPTKYAAPLNVMSVPGPTIFAINDVVGIESFASDTTIYLTAVGTLALLAALSGGSVDVYVFVRSLDG